MPPEPHARAQDPSQTLLVTPELALCGYPPRDLLYDPDFVAEALAATTELADELSGASRWPGGAVRNARPGSSDGDDPPRHPGLYDAAVLLQGGEVRACSQAPAAGLRRLYEPRWFVPGPIGAPIPFAGHRLGVLLCEDLWDDAYATHPARELVAAGADLLVCLSASPYRLGCWRSGWVTPDAPRPSAFRWSTSTPSAPTTS